MTSEPSIWDKIDYDVVAAAAAESQQQTAASQEKKEDAKKSLWKKARWRLLDMLSIIFWCYLVANLVIFDFDKLITDHAPGARQLFDHRFLVFLVLLSILSLTWRLKFFIPVLYVFMFPLVILFWKIPKFLYYRKSWTLFFGFMHLLFVGYWGFRRTIIGFTAFCFSIFFMTLGWDWSSFLAGIIAAILLTFTLIHSTIEAFRPIKFMTTQINLFTKLTKSNLTADSWRIKPELKNNDIVKFDKGQLEIFSQGLTSATVIYYGAHFWAYRLENYRRSGAGMLFSSAALLWLIISASVNLCLINLAIFTVAPNQYAVDDAGSSVIRFAYYSLSSLFINEISGLTPTGAVAILTKLVAGFIGAVLLVLLLVTIYMSFRQDKNGARVQEAIDELQARANEFEEQMRLEYGVGPAEALERLTQMKKGTQALIVQLMGSIPKEFFRGYTGLQ